MTENEINCDVNGVTLIVTLSLLAKFVSTLQHVSPAACFLTLYLSGISRFSVFGDVWSWNSKPNGDLHNVWGVLLVSRQAGIPESVRGSDLRYDDVVGYGTSRALALLGMVFKGNKDVDPIKKIKNLHF